MKNTPFFKVVGSGNDFILLDCRRRAGPPDPARFARQWCDRKRGVGADGLLLVLSSPQASARMRIFNPDGSEAAMCGNGLRCVAWYLAASNGHRALTVQTRAGTLSARVVRPEQVRTFFGPPRNLRLGLSLSHRGRKYLVHSVDTGVPHAVLIVSDLQKADLSALGPHIRFHRRFRPGGTNVDLLRVESPRRVSIRTYERGVEQETLACGTGAVAGVVIGAALGRLTPPVQVRTAGGDVLTVNFRPGRHPWQELSLEGPVRVLFEGKLGA